MTKHRLSFVAALTAVVAAALLFTPSIQAHGPTQGTGGEPPGDSTILPLTTEQLASKAVKDQLIAEMLSSPRGEITPDYVCQFDPCEPYSRVLTVYPRQQVKSYFCGPATVQIVSNYSWGKTGDANKYSQQYISDHWTHTDAHGQTYLADEINGMNNASSRPPQFVYVQLHDPTYDQWHAAIVVDVYFSHSGPGRWDMPLAAGVIPWKTGGTYHLVSWNKKSNGGHYIELHGYQGRVGDATRYVWFSDAAGTYADSVAANWQQSSYAVFQTMVYNNKNMIY